MVPRPRATAATRDRIVERALSLLSERGTTGVSMRELADAAGVTVPGLYYHFASKAELIRAVFRRRSGREPLVPLAPGPVLQLMQRESVLGDADAREVGAALGAEWRERWHETLSRGTDLAPEADVSAAT